MCPLRTSPPQPISAPTVGGLALPPGVRFMALRPCAQSAVNGAQIQVHSGSGCTVYLLVVTYNSSVIRVQSGVSTYFYTFSGKHVFWLQYF